MTINDMLGGAIGIYSPLQQAFSYCAPYQSNRNPLELIEEKLKNNKEQILKLQDEIVLLEEAKKLIEENPIQVRLLWLLKRFGLYQ
jgi:hypothetical protein